MPVIECQECGAKTRALFSGVGRRHCESCGELLPAPPPARRERLTETVTDAARKAALPLQRRRRGKD
jgi:hypothetical protein